MPWIRQVQIAEATGPLDAVQVVAYFNYITRVADGLGVEPEDFIERWGV